MLFLWTSFLLSALSANGQKDILNTEGLIICGHRGGFYTSFPENSLQVINHVIDQVNSFPLIIEVDIRQSKDGTLFIMHDETVDRTTNGMGRIAELSDIEIRSLRLKKSDGVITDQRVLSLNELLDTLNSKSVGLMLDIKGDLFIQTASLIVEKGWTKRSVFLTFNPEHTQLLYQFSDELIISALVKKQADWELLQKKDILLKKLITYVARDSESKFVNQLRKKGFRIMADVSEHTTHEGMLYDERYYQGRIKTQLLDIMITDFPIEVVRMVK